MLIKASRRYGIGFGLLTLAAAAACSSAGGDAGNSTGGTGTTHAGSSNTLAGSGNTTAGSSAGGSGGTGNTTAGSSAGGNHTTAGSSAGGSGGASSACAGTKPASALITEFADLVPNALSAGQFTFTLGVPGGTFAYQAMALSVTDASKSLNVKGNVKNYDGFGVYTTACTDASAYTGVSFNIKGNAGPGGKLNFRVQTNADMAVDTVNKKGACVVPAGTADPYPLCHPSSFDIAVTADAKTVAVKFSELVGGVPVAAVSGKDIVGFEWAFAWAGPSDTAYDADITLDDLKLTGGSVGGGGGDAGGSGGGGGGGTGGTQ